MTSFRFSRRLLFSLVLAALVGGALAVGLFYRYALEGTEIGFADHSPRQKEDGWSVVCMGHVDVEGGLVSLSPEQPGRIVEVLAQEGEIVTKGTALLRLDDSSAQFMLAQAKATLNLAEVQLAKALEHLEQQPLRIAQQGASVEASKYRLSAARHTLQRQRDLFKEALAGSWEVAVAEDRLKELNALVQVESERLKELRMSKPALVVQEAQAKVEECRANLRQANYNLERCTLKAPEPGIVLRVLVGAGEVVGGPNAKPSILFCPDWPLLIRAEIEQEFVGRVMVGQTAQIENEVQPIVACRGRVKRVANWYSQRRTIPAQPGQFKDVPTVECLVSLDKGNPPFRLGQRVTVKLLERAEP